MDEKGEKVRPNQNRCIVILREIPESTPVEVSRFSSEGHVGTSVWVFCFDFFLTSVFFGEHILKDKYLQ